MKIVVSSGIVEGAPIVVCCKHEEGVYCTPPSQDGPKLGV